MDISYQDLDSSRDSIFSPLQLNRVPSIPTGSHPQDSTLPGSQSEESTLSPLTISAQDIQSCSLDITELGNAKLVSNSQSSPLNASTREPMSHGCSAANVSPSLSSSLVRARNAKENMHTPSETVNSSVVRVRVSAKKLREIQSPYTSFTSNSTVDDRDSVSGEQVALDSSQTSHPPDSKQPSSNNPPLCLTSTTDHSRSNPLKPSVAGIPSNRERASALKGTESDLHERNVVASTPKPLSSLHGRSASSEGMHGGVGELVRLVLQRGNMHMLYMGMYGGGVNN